MTIACEEAETETTTTSSTTTTATTTTSATTTSETGQTTTQTDLDPAGDYTTAGPWTAGQVWGETVGSSGNVLYIGTWFPSQDTGSALIEYGWTGWWNTG